MLKNRVANPFERGVVFFLHGALQQYFFDGNKRTSRAMMNGIPMSSGIDSISIPAARRQEFNEKMVRFYLGREGTEMIAFLGELLPASLAEGVLVFLLLLLLLYWRRIIPLGQTSSIAFPFSRLTGNRSGSRFRNRARPLRRQL